MTTLSQKTDEGGVNDIFIDDDGVLAMSHGRTSYADIIADRIRTIKGELPLDKDVGIDYFGTIFKSVSRSNIWRHYVKSAIEKLPFVIGITEFYSSFNPSTKILSYSISVNTDEGIVEISGKDNMQ